LTCFSRDSGQNPASVFPISLFGFSHPGRKRAAAQLFRCAALRLNPVGATTDLFGPFAIARSRFDFPDQCDWNSS
jgi:hypothetical protein